MAPISESSKANDIESISAVTLAVRDMARALAFYRALGFRLAYGGDESSFSSLEAGDQRLNLELASHASMPSDTVWGRVIVWVRDVDVVYEHAIGNGLAPEAPPRDAEWGERYFHLRDPDGHELSFARPLEEPRSHDS